MNQRKTCDSESTHDPTLRRTHGYVSESLRYDMHVWSHYSYCLVLSRLTISLIELGPERTVSSALRLSLTTCLTTATWAPTRAGPGLRNFRGRPGGGTSRRPPNLTRLLGIVARNGKKRSKARRKPFRNYFSQFLAQVNIEVTVGHQGSNDTNGFR